MVQSNDAPVKILIVGPLQDYAPHSRKKNQIFNKLEI